MAYTVVITSYYAYNEIYNAYNKYIIYMLSESKFNCLR